MGSRARARVCPVCAFHFIPWSAWRITRWSGIACPNCHSRLGRRVDLQFFTIVAAVVPWTLVLTLWRPPAWVLVLVAAVLIVCAYIVDALTVRLVPLPRSDAQGPRV